MEAMTRVCHQQRVFLAGEPVVAGVSSAVNTFAAAVFPAPSDPNRAGPGIRRDAVEHGTVMAEPFMGSTIAGRADIGPLPS
ncbi:hypothetical protein ACIHFD_01330 [Nonomuraea sp. NPDC051941]|uniref:hypothetical protein n=1 Tax=Nonomuraea sp. NPDC051941 TaxID=3364373 RepID=UPI0037CBFACC